MTTYDDTLHNRAFREILTELAKFKVQPGPARGRLMKAIRLYGNTAVMDYAFRTTEKKAHQLQLISKVVVTDAEELGL